MKIKKISSTNLGTYVNHLGGNFTSDFDKGLCKDLSKVFVTDLRKAFNTNFLLLNNLQKTAANGKIQIFKNVQKYLRQQSTFL